MDFPPLPDRDYPDETMVSRFQPVGELDAEILSRAEEGGQAVKLFHTKCKKNSYNAGNSFRAAFNPLIRHSTEAAVNDGTVSVESGTSGQVICIDPFEGIHRRAKVNEQAISMPFLRHRVVYLHPRNVINDIPIDK